jgi:Methyltransferase domain
MPSILDVRDSYRSTIAFLPSRTELPVLLNERMLLGCGAEVGVKEGEYSATLLTYWRGQHLISIDPWLEDAAGAYVDIANVAQAHHERFYDTARARLAPFGARSTVWRMASLDAAARVPRHSLDFVYIDARHDYDSVLEDLDAWFDKVRPGGIVAGHDYLDGKLAAGDFGVKSAVDAFFFARSLPVYPTLLDQPWLTWIVEVPLPGYAPDLPPA